MVTAYQITNDFFIFMIIKQIERRAFCLLVDELLKQGFNYETAVRIARLELYGEP